MVGIYKIISPSGKIYIGKAFDIKRRWNSYYGLHKLIIGPKLYNSLKKYGPKNHIFKVLEECDKKLLEEKEAYYKQQVIDELGWNFALFCEIFDKGGGPKSEETKRKIGEGNKGKIMTEEHKKKLNVKILQYNLKGNFIKEWKSNKEASEELNIGAGDISSCCTNNQKTAGGFIWRYKKGKIKDKISTPKKKTGKKVIRLNKNKQIIKEYINCREAGKDLNTDPANIRIIILKKRFYKNSYFKYKNK